MRPATWSVRAARKKCLMGLDSHTHRQEYIGTGHVAELVARQDALARDKRRLDALAFQEEETELATLDAALQELTETTDLVARTALLAAGFHQHKRGEWRRRRVKRNATR
jgi:hypothetical protein